MASWGSVEFDDLKKWQERMEKMASVDFDRICKELSKEIAKILLNKVKKLTPVGRTPEYLKKAPKKVKVTGASGKKRTLFSREAAILHQYWSGYTGGTLRDAWTVQVEKQGDGYVVTLVNPTEYASYVEYGHRQTPGRYVPALGLSLKQSWMQGKFMLTISIQEMKALVPRMVEKTIYEYLKEVFNAE